MNFMLILWIVWGVALVSWLVLLAYQAQITRYEEEQLFLSNAQETQHHEQDEIVAKVNTIKPVLRILASATAVLTVVIIGLYAWDAIQRLM
jgi:hypothetical protein